MGEVVAQSNQPSKMMLGIQLHFLEVRLDGSTQVPSPTCSQNPGEQVGLGTFRLSDAPEMVRPNQRANALSMPRRARAVKARGFLESLRSDLPGPGQSVANGGEYGR